MLDDPTASALRAALSSLAETIAPKLSQMPVPQVAGWNISFGEDGSVSMSDGLVAEPAFVIGNVGQWVQSLSPYTALREIVAQSEVLIKHFASDPSTGSSFRDDVLWQRVNTLLNHVLLPSFQFDAERFTDVYDSMGVELQKPTFTYLVRAYFRFIGPQVLTDIPFTSIGVIRKLARDELIRLVRSLKFYRDLGPAASDATMFQSVLELRFESSKTNIFEVQPPRPLDDFQIALRLAIGRVAFAFATIDLESVFRTSFRHMLLPFRDSSRFGGPLSMLPGVQISLDDAAYASELFDRLGDPIKTRSIKTAVRRYNDTLERNRLDDALIDCVVGLESILNQDGATDVTRRLRQRLALAIGTSIEDRVSVYEEMSKIYAARSKIAHGDEPKQPVPTLFNLAEQYLGRLLRRLLDDRAPLDLAKLDVALVRGDAAFAVSERSASQAPAAGH